MEDIVMDGEVTPPASPPWEPREGGGLFGGDLGRRCGHTHTLPQPLPPALVMPPPFDHGHYGGTPFALRSVRAPAFSTSRRCKAGLSPSATVAVLGLVGA